MTKIAGILFDKDGTLLDYFKSWSPVNRKLALIAAEGDQALADDLLRATGMDPVSGHVVADSLLAAGNTEEIAEGLVAAGSRLSAQQLIRDLDWLFAEAATNAVPVTDLEALFGRLRARGLKLGVASSDNEISIRRTAERFGFHSYLDYIAGYDTGYGCKPEPGMVLGFAHMTGLTPRQIMVVGDNSHDMLMGRNASVGLTVGVLTGTGTRETLTPLCDYCVNDITEIETLI
ncbi:MAG TPA: HAD family hydrolase [Ensifer sp.]|nr:HAD family hydrolase [Ensifer sp.]